MKRVLSTLCGKYQIEKILITPEHQLYDAFKSDVKGLEGILNNMKACAKRLELD